jgi:dihydropteroate synthase
MTTKLVGILNVTPDSFSDGGKFNSLENAIFHLKKMLNDGADMIDIGAESTRPGFTPVSVEEEWKRLQELLPKIIHEVKNFNHENNKKVTTSIDTRHFETAKKAYELGVDIINDVDGLIDDRTIDFIAQNNITTILMHNLKVPAIEETLINKHLNLIVEIIKWAQEKISYLIQKGVKKSQLIFDVGIGFGKNSLQSIRILKNIDEFRVLELPLYVGHSKKSFLEAIDFSEIGENLDRAEKTLVISDYLIKKNIDFIRVHDVEKNKFLIHNSSFRKTPL